MFTPEPMREVNLFILDEDIVPVTAALIRLGILQIEEVEYGTTPVESRWASLANTYADQERRLRELLDSLGISLQTQPVPEDIHLETDLSHIESVLHQAEEAVQSWQHRKQQAEEEAERLRLMIEQLNLLAPVEIPVEQLTRLQHLYLQVGTMPAANLARLQTALFRIPFVIIPTHEHNARTLVFAATTHEYAPILDRALRSAFFEPITLPQDVSGAPAQALAELERRRNTTLQQIAALDKEHQQLIQTWQERLLTLWNQARTGAALAGAIQRFSREGRIYLIAGWVPARSLQPLVDTIQKVTEGRAVIEVLEPNISRAQVPTLLRNPPLLRTFEGIVTTFGFPAYNELDPTPLVAPIFVIMYGMMFGDAGHGLLLALLGVWLRRRGGSLARMSPVLIAAGLSAMVFGLLYGSVLGLELLHPIWLRPLTNMTELLISAVAAGVVLLNAGFLLNMLSAWRERNWPRLLFDKNGLAGLWLYWSLVGGGLMALRGVTLPNTWGILVTLPALLIFFREPLSRRWIRAEAFPEIRWGEYAVQSFFELFEALISYISNSLSFVRLGAFAVAHEGLSQVVFLLAGMAGDPARWVVIALGTLLIVGFEGLIVGIQTLRLVYYEFFGKFYEGRGRPFVPLRLPEI